MRGRLPRTSYGYQPPPGATARGWHCPNEDCGRSNHGSPRRWPYPCPECGGPTDPVLDEPWAHDAEGVRLRHLAATADFREFHRWNLDVREYEDARRRGDVEEAGRRRREMRRQELSRCQDPGVFWSMADLVRTALRTDDVDGAAEELLQWYPFVRTEDVEDDNTQRTAARSFVSLSIEFLGRPESIGHPHESGVLAALEDLVRRAGSVLFNHEDGLRRVRQLRGTDAEIGRIAARTASDVAGGTDLPRAVRRRRRRAAPAYGRSVVPRLREAEDRVARARSHNRPEDLAEAVGDLGALLSEPGLEPVVLLRAAAALADAAIALDEIHGDPGILADAADRLEQAGAATVLVQLLRARTQLALRNEDPGADDARGRAAEAALLRASPADDPLTADLWPEIMATLARLAVARDPAAVDRAIALCRSGRSGVGPYRTTAADLTLAQLLVRRGLDERTEPDLANAAIDEAARLSRRLCRPWQVGGAPARRVLHEARCARDALSGGGAGPDGRLVGWRRAADRSAGAPTAERARLATAWVAWALTTDRVEVIAEAYAHLMTIVPLDAAFRYRLTAKDRVLAAAQEHTEEAGYWLGRAGRYREAVLAVEAGRAVRLSEMGRREWGDLLDEAGEHDLAGRLRAALVVLEAEDGKSAADHRRAWVGLRAAARRIADLTGVDPLALDPSYEDVTAVTRDGAVVYLAAAKSGGYALVVASAHDPQFVELPRLDRASVAGVVDAVLPDEEGRPPDRARMDEGLRRLWDDALRDLMWQHVRGDVVTLIPVGLLSLLPLHAAGPAAPPGDEDTDGQHTGRFSAVRYAPNARALLRCQETAERLAAARLSLVIGDVPVAPGQPILPGAPIEASAVVGRWDPVSTRLLHDCTWDEFRATAGKETVWHLACHGEARPGRILDSALHFADGPVTLRQLRAEFRPARRRLAVLSCCESNITALDNPNEVVGLPSALLQLGFAGVIASSWRVSDVTTIFLMARFHQLWRECGMPPPIALNQAARWLRRAGPDDLATLVPDLADVVRPDAGNPHPGADRQAWAAFTYTGA